MGRSARRPKRATSSSSSRSRPRTPWSTPRWARTSTSKYTCPSHLSTTHPRVLEFPRQACAASKGPLYKFSPHRENHPAEHLHEDSIEKTLTTQSNSNKTKESIFRK